MTTPDQLRDIVRYLQNRVVLHPEGGRRLIFDSPSVEALVADGLDGATARRLLAVSWWSEMVGDVLETPDLVEPDTPYEEMLGYARDVIHEHVAKRFPLDR